MYFGSSTGATTGSGRCFHFFNGQQGNLSYNPSYQFPDAGNPLFGSAYLLQASENLLCPTYNGTYFLDAQGQVYYILCGYGSTSQYQNVAARDGPGCLALCDAQAQCIGVTVVYGGAETNANNNANCYLASADLNTIANIRNVLAVRTTMPPFVPTTTTTTTTTLSTTSAAASSTCTFAVSPTGLPTNCGGRSSTASFLGVYNDTCGVTYSIYCRADSNPLQADQVSAGSISACMALCDNYVFADGSICQSATLYQGWCYLKRSFDGFKNSNTDTTVMVRNSNQNLLLANSSSSTASPTATVPYSTTLSAYTSYQPTNTWTINSGSCASGMGPAAATATAGGQGGVYTDIYNSYWEMDCDYAFSGADNYDGATTGSGTGSLGVYGCFNGCAQRPNCIGFSYYGTQSEPARGAGRCYFYGSGQQGDLVYSPTAGAPQATTTPIYGSAYLIQGSPVNMCPYWHNQYYVDSSNVTYYIMCGSDGTGNQTYDGSLQTSYTGTSYSWLTCLQSCSSSGISDCSGVTYKYTGLTTNPTIQCSYRRGRITPDGSPYGRVAIAIVTTLPSSSSRTSGASSSAPPQTVTYTYLSSYPVTYTTSYVTTAVSTAPGSTVISTYVTTHIRDHGPCQYHNIDASSFYEYLDDDPTNDRHFNRTNHSNIHRTIYGNFYRTNDPSGLNKYINDHRTNDCNFDSSGLDKHVDNHTKDDGDLHRTNDTSSINKYINNHRKDDGNINGTNHRNIDTPGVNKYTNDHGDFDRAIYGHVNRTNHLHIAGDHSNLNRAANRDNDGHINGKNHGNIYRANDFHRAIDGDNDGHINGENHGNIYRAIDFHRAIDGDYDGHIYGKDHRNIYRATDRYYDGDIYRALDGHHDGYIYGENHGDLNRANDGPRNPNIYNCIIISSHHHHCEHSIWLDHNADYKLLCNIHGNQHDSGLFDGASSYGDIYNCCTDGDTDYGILIWRHIHHVLSRHGYGNYIDSRLDRRFHLRLIISTQVSSYGVTTTAPGTYAKDAPMEPIPGQRVAI
ncbi:hypothetical protein KC315_g7835 [Hortaea werneckii]|nr:hypothetical protein KC315_g7835 [Hortaea werneckii]